MPPEARLALLQDQLNLLRQQYARRLPDRLEDIVTSWQALRNDGSPVALLPGLHRAVHSLAGSGTTFGFTAMSETARTLEHFLHSIIERGGALSAEHEAQITVFIARLCESSQTYEPHAAQLAFASEAVVAAVSEPATQSQIFIVAAPDAWVTDLANQLSYFGYSSRLFAGLDEAHVASQAAIPLALLIDHAHLAADATSTAMIAALRQRQAFPIPIIFIADHGDFASRLAAAQSGGRAYFIKPLDIGAVIDKLDVLISHHAPVPYRILIVDDDEILTNYFSQTLIQAGMTTCVVNDPLTVTVPLSEFRPDVILMDVYMPGCTGLELATVIRQQETYVGTPILFLSAQASMENQLMAIGLGADDFLQKPIAPDYLISWVASRAQRSRTLRFLMAHDSLTGVFKRSKLTEQLVLAVAHATRSGSPLTLAMLDIDHFKTVNVTYGHLAGDRAIKRLARLLQQQLPAPNVIGRYGGEEFVVLLPDTPLKPAIDLLEEISATFAQIRHPIDHGDFSVSVSCGLASFPEHATPTSLNHAADQALHAAKRAGRNCVRALSGLT
ncbi:MAG: diguanylate cyclase [Herpetosiphonaceae bacterium]|nr:diguanylate cyclase [Herpetosiphonaceae bacterium]